MIDVSTIEEAEDFDGEFVLALGFDPDTDQWRRDWVHVDDLAEAGRSDILEDMGLIRRWDEAA